MKIFIVVNQGDDWTEMWTLRVGAGAAETDRAPPPPPSSEEIGRNGRLYCSRMLQLRRLVIFLIFLFPLPLAAQSDENEKKNEEKVKQERDLNKATTTMKTNKRDSFAPLETVPATKGVVALARNFPFRRRYCFVGACKRSQKFPITATAERMYKIIHL